nr:MAG TPA: hypothetical protein [Bacteriophage sp.]
MSGRSGNDIIQVSKLIVSSGAPGKRKSTEKPFLVAARGGFSCLTNSVG